MVKKVTALLGVAMLGGAGLSAPWKDNVSFRSYWTAPSQEVLEESIRAARAQFKAVIGADQRHQFYLTGVQELKSKFETIFPDPAHRKAIINRENNNLLIGAMEARAADMINMLLEFGADPRAIFAFDYQGTQGKKLHALKFFLTNCQFFPKLDAIFHANQTDIALTGLRASLIGDNVHYSRLVNGVVELRTAFIANQPEKPEPKPAADEDEKEADKGDTKITVTPAVATCANKTK